MAHLEGQVGELTFELAITRKDTGATERVRLTGFVNQEQLEALQRQGLISQGEKHDNGNASP